MSKGVKSIFTIAIVFTFFIALLFIIPASFISGDVSNIITICTFILAILLGFFIAASLSNYLSLQTLAAEETANFIALYRTYQLLDPKLAEEVRAKIDEYIIYSFDFEFIEYMDNTWSHFNRVINVSKKIEDKNGSLFESILDIQTNMIATRQKMVVTSRKIMSFSNWFILFILSVAQILLLYSIRTDSLLSTLITVILSSANVLTLILLKDIDANNFAELPFAYNVFQRVLSEIGVLPYYLDADIKEKRVKPVESTYRVGLWKEKFFEVENRHIEVINK